MRYISNLVPALQRLVLIVVKYLSRPINLCVCGGNGGNLSQTDTFP